MVFGDLDTNCTYLIKSSNLENSYKIYVPRVNKRPYELKFTVILIFDIYFTVIFILLKSQIYWNLPFQDYWKLLKLSPRTEITGIQISFLGDDIH